MILQEVSACPPEKSYTSKEIVWGARFCHKSVLDRVGMINIASNHTFTIPYNPMRGKSGVLE